MEQLDPLDMISFRNLQDGFDPLGTPLREFRGHLEALETESVVANYDGREVQRLYVHFKFTNVDVVTAQEPYDLPIADVRLPYSNNKRSAWGVLASSAVKLLVEGMDVRDTIGTDQHWKVTDNHMLWDGRQRKEVPRQCWEVLEIGGAGQVQVDVMVRVKDLLNGATIQQFNSAALSDPIIRSNPEIQQAVISRTLVNSLVEKGEVVVDDNGVYHVMQ